MPGFGVHSRAPCVFVNAVSGAQQRRPTGLRGLQCSFNAPASSRGEADGVLKEGLKEGSSSHG